MTIDNKKVSILILVPFLFGVALITTAAVYQFGIYALYVPGFASVIISLFFWEIVSGVKTP